jgi:sulfite reductase alpha subunit-like flavoprotein
LTQAEKSGIISGLRIAFSRDSEKKVYVQHHIQEDADIIWDILHNQGGHFYVCGDAKYMAKDVERTLISIFKEKGKMNDKEANDFLNLITEQNRYLRDVWSP